MTNDIVRLRDALTRDSDETLFRDRLKQESGEIRRSLDDSGEYRVQTPKGTIVIRSVKRTA
jgi:hypothetical protein